MMLTTVSIQQVTFGYMKKKNWLRSKYSSIR